MVKTGLGGTRYMEFERGTTCLAAICAANGWQGGTIHDAVKTVTFSKKYNVRRYYNAETYYTRDVLVNGIQIGTATGWHSDHKEVDRDPTQLPGMFHPRTH